MSKPVLACLSLSGLLLVPACSNYDFARVRLPNGDWDYQQLMWDLDLSRQNALVATTWIPLIYTDVMIFRASPPGMPDGYTLQSVVGIGPLFCVSGGSEHVVGRRGDFVEATEGTIHWMGALQEGARSYCYPAGRPCGALEQVGSLEFES